MKAWNVFALASALMGVAVYIVANPHDFVMGYVIAGWLFGVAWISFLIGLVTGEGK